MIKLIATDVDGTLCRISTPKIHEGYYAAARTLLDKGVKFVAASGRQYDGLLRTFAPVAAASTRHWHVFLIRYMKNFFI